MNLLIVNIGSRDVQIDTQLLPDELRDFRQVSERKRGQFLLDHYADLRPHLRLAKIRKALAYILDEESSINHIVLIGSDQDDLRFRATDTIITAQVAKRLIVDHWPISESQIDVWPLRNAEGGVNPADVDAVINHLERQLDQLERSGKYETVYLEGTGGTTAMSEGLLIVGTKIFQHRAVALYISPLDEMPHHLAVGKRLLGGPLLDVINAHLNSFHYQAAAEAFSRYRPIYADNATHSKAELVEAIMAYARYRIQLDLKAARVAIRGKDNLAGGSYRAQVAQLYNVIVNPARAQMLAEVLHVATIRFRTGAYGDFLTQTVRFVENVLRAECLRHGVVFINHHGTVDVNGARVDPKWLKQNQLKGVPSGQAGLQRLLEQIAPDDSQTHQLLDAAHRLEPLIWLRNESTHSLSGISTKEIGTAFGDGYAMILPFLEDMYKAVTGTRLESNPYEAINTFLSRLLVAQ